MLEMLEHLEEEHEVKKETQRKVRVSQGSFTVLFITFNKSFAFQLYYLQTTVNFCRMGCAKSMDNRFYRQSA